MAAGDSEDREKYVPNTQIFVLGTGVRTVRSAKFDDHGRCVEWTDTLGVTRRPWLSAG